MAEAASAGRRRGAPSRIDLETVVDCALEIVDGEGFDALALRSVAARAGVVPSALYRYVTSADELFDLVVDRVVERLAPQGLRPRDWEEGVRAWARYVRRGLIEHPAILAAACRRPVVNRRALEAVEQLVETPLREAGLEPRAIDDVYRAAYAFVVGWVSLEQGRARAREQAGTSVAEQSLAVSESLRDTGLSGIVAGAEHIAQPYDEEHFERGLDLVCDGIRLQVGARA